MTVRATAACEMYMIEKEELSDAFSQLPESASATLRDVAVTEALALFVNADGAGGAAGGGGGGAAGAGGAAVAVGVDQEVGDGAELDLEATHGQHAVTMGPGAGRAGGTLAGGGEKTLPPGFADAVYTALGDVLDVGALGHERALACERRVGAVEVALFHLGERLLSLIHI